VRNAIIVSGPTASGKTALAIELAERLDSEIISADSMQVYKGMEIGAAAPAPEDQARVKHHFVSFLEPDEQFSAGAFERMARPVIDDLNARGKIAVVAGGAGLYIRALIEGLFHGPERDDSIHERLYREAEEKGMPALFARLNKCDPVYAGLINENDPRRIMRALEVYELTGEPLSKLHAEHQAGAMPLNVVQTAFDWPRDELYARVDKRVDIMLKSGFLDEVQRLLDTGHGEHIQRLRSLGYREFAKYLAGDCSYEEAADAMKQNTRRFAKRQLTWFRNDPAIHWIKVEPDRDMRSYVEEVLNLL